MLVEAEIRAAKSVSGMFARGLFTVGSAVAVAIAFSTNSQFSGWLLTSLSVDGAVYDGDGGDVVSAPEPSALHSAVSHLVTGGLGGVLHAVVMSGVTAGSTVVHSTSMRELLDSTERARCARLFVRR